MDLHRASKHWRSEISASWRYLNGMIASYQGGQASKRALARLSANRAMDKIRTQFG